MLEKPLDQLQSTDFDDLVRLETPEGLRLEFKESLALDQPTQRRELAKDISGMANAAGGRIVYGIAERELPDGSKVAGEVRPLEDGTLQERIATVIATTVHPRPHYRSHKVSVRDGFVLVVEIYDSYGRDLHMVTAYGERRFYRRTDRSVEPMTEPEIREAYRRIATSTADLEPELEDAIRKELNLRRSAEESVLIAPWYPRRNLANPLAVHETRKLLAGGPLRSFDRDSSITNLSVFAGGLRALAPHDATPEDASTYFTITRAGIIHLSKKSVVVRTGYQGRPSYDPFETLHQISAAIRAAQVVYDKVAYWGPVRVVHRLTLNDEAFLIRGAGRMDIWLPGRRTSLAEEVNLRELGGDIDLVLREILDELFQAAGDLCCPWFDESGRIKSEYRSAMVD